MNPIPSEPGEITRLLRGFTEGDPAAAEELIPPSSIKN